MRYISEALNKLKEMQLDEMAKTLKDARDYATNQSFNFMRHMACFIASYIKKDINLQDINHYINESEDIFLKVVTTKVKTKSGYLPIKDIYDSFLDGHVMRLIIENIDDEHKLIFENVDINYISNLYAIFIQKIKNKLIHNINAKDIFNQSLDEIKNIIDKDYKK